MRRLSLFRTIEFLLRLKRRMTKPMPMPESEIPPPASFEAPPVMEVTAVVEPVEVFPRHLLDDAPVHSKIVVVREVSSTVAILALTSGEQVILGGDDPAANLPVGARIQKTDDHTFVARQLGGTGMIAEAISHSAYQAITGFMAHFHPTQA